MSARPCPACGAAPGEPCAGLRAGALHPSRRPPKRPRPGAPARQGEAATRLLSVRLTVAELAAVDLAATGQALTRGEYVRRALASAARRDRPESDGLGYP